MDHPVFYCSAVLIGFVALIYGADKFVEGASTLAKHFGVSPLIIGLTIVSLGTSAPEIFTSAAAALTGSPDIAIGNVIGSNIANIGLVLGITALFIPLKIPSTLMKQEIPILLTVSVVSLVLFIDGELNWIDGSILLVLLGLFVWRMYANSTLQSDTSIDNDAEIEEYLTDLSPLMAGIILLIGLMLMVAGSNILIWGARNLALIMGVPELIVGLTVIAIGTSLPELATTITSAMKGHDELAIGNIVGSNILNLLIVLPVPAFVGGALIQDEVINRDMSAMLILTAILSILVFLLLPKKRRIGRLSGAVFIIFYLAYTALLIFQ